MRNYYPASVLLLLVIALPFVVRATAIDTIPKKDTIRSKTLSEVIVTGFQNIEKKKFTGAAVRLKAEDVKIDGLADVSRMLEGRAPGVSVQNVSSTFGSAPKVRIRGATSINGDNKPLWVIDGVVLEDIVNVSNEQLTSGDASTLLGSSVAGLNINDIETFDILKDASAAIYGARSANGVILITTKKGTSGKPKITYDFNQGLSQPARIPKMSDAFEYAQIMNEIPIYKTIPVNEWQAAWTAIQQRFRFSSRIRQAIRCQTDPSFSSRLRAGR